MKWNRVNTYKETLELRTVKTRFLHSVKERLELIGKRKPGNIERGDKDKLRSNREEYNKKTIKDLHKEKWRKLNVKSIIGKEVEIIEEMKLQDMNYLVTTKWDYMRICEEKI